MDPTEFMFKILILVFSVVIHEVSHGLAAYALGDNTAKWMGRLTLNPLKHLDLWGSLIIPAISFVVAGFMLLIIAAISRFIIGHPYSLLGVRALSLIGLANTFFLLAALVRLSEKK